MKIGCIVCQCHFQFHQKSKFFWSLCSIDLFLGSLWSLLMYLIQSLSFLILRKRGDLLLAVLKAGWLFKCKISLLISELFSFLSFEWDNSSRVDWFGSSLIFFNSMAFSFKLKIGKLVKNNKNLIWCTYFCTPTQRIQLGSLRQCLLYVNFPFPTYHVS